MIKNLDIIFENINCDEKTKKFIEILTYQEKIIFIKIILLNTKHKNDFYDELYKNYGLKSFKDITKLLDSLEFKIFKTKLEHFSEKNLKGE